MPSSSNVVRRARRRLPIGVPLSIALLVAAAMAGLALARPFTLNVSKNVHVTNRPINAPKAKTVDTHEAVAIGSAGYAVYTFQGETTHHIICKKTNSSKTNCWAFWPPVTVSSSKGLSKQTGIHGTLGTFRNHGLLQLTLNGQPLYYFTPDLQSHNKKQATGDQLKTFGSTWHIVKAAGQSTKPKSSSTSSSTTGTFY